MTVLISWFLTKVVIVPFCGNETESQPSSDYICIHNFISDSNSEIWHPVSSRDKPTDAVVADHNGLPSPGFTPISVDRGKALI